MQFTLESLKMVEESLVKLLKEDLPIRISYKLSKFYEIINKEMIRVEELRQELVKRYGEEKDGITRVTQDNIVEFNKDYGDLMCEPVDAGTFESITLAQILSYSEKLELMGKQPISLSALDLHKLKSVGILKDNEE